MGAPHNNVALPLVGAVLFLFSPAAEITQGSTALGRFPAAPLRLQPLSSTPFVGSLRVSMHRVPS
ncbi:hypothetical protein F9C07_6810 [Aspergillus flavus]|uniref:Secreted protein n=1 Tax=Aspergillus flavus (strain ATCC 200026 / FGSC A1120 / IAM 13836 / NRRL 3357 / JCM 12722 / SRRC 167) TaxID=332952 RepID=A0A7U2MH13_ASPFN|nr:hypothetical protein F9C07_6810 [Aspergillus flavus]